MSNSRSLMYWNDKLGDTQPWAMRFVYEINGAKDISLVVPGSPIYHSFDAIAAQATIDDFLGTTDEFTIAQFDATALGVDAIGGFVRMDKQASKGVKMRAALLSGADGSTVVEDNVKFVSSLTDSSLTTQAAVGADGNIGWRAVITGLDAATAGLVVVEFDWLSK